MTATPQLDRRGLLRLGAASSLGFALSPIGAAGPLLARAVARPRFAADPFTLGVASGDPDAGGVVLWTRLAPRPLECERMSGAHACATTLSPYVV